MMGGVVAKMGGESERRGRWRFKSVQRSVCSAPKGDQGRPGKPPTCRRRAPSREPGTLQAHATANQPRQQTFIFDPKLQGTGHPPHLSTPHPSASLRIHSLRIAQTSPTLGKFPAGGWSGVDPALNRAQPREPRGSQRPRGHCRSTRCRCRLERELELAWRTAPPYLFCWHVSMQGRSDMSRARTASKVDSQRAKAGETSSANSSLRLASTFTSATPRSIHC